MGHHSEVFIGIDTWKLRNAVAIAEAGRRGEVRYLGEIDTSEAATRKMVAGLAAKHAELTFCYEAGPTGYGLRRLIESLDNLTPADVYFGHGQRILDMRKEIKRKTIEKRRRQHFKAAA